MSKPIINLLTWGSKPNELSPTAVDYNMDIEDIYNASIEAGDLSTEECNLDDIADSIEYKQVMALWVSSHYDMMYVPALYMTEDDRIAIRNGSKAYPKSTMVHNPYTPIGRVQAIYNWLCSRYDSTIWYTELDLYEFMVYMGYHSLYAYWVQSGYNYEDTPMVVKYNREGRYDLNNLQLLTQVEVELIKLGL